jgi:hypothetical protein
VALGILIAGLSGLCTLLVLGLYVVDLTQNHAVLGELASAMLIGGVPFAIGVGLIFAGRALLKKP